MRLFALIATICAVAFATPGYADNVGVAPPQRFQFDANNVDLVGLQHLGSVVDLSVGASAESQLQYRRNYGRSYGGDNMYNLAIYNTTGSTWSAAVGLTSELFTLSGTTYTSQAGQGATLIKTGTVSAPIYTLTTSNGTRIIYDYTKRSFLDFGAQARATKIIYPSGEVVNIRWVFVTYCTSSLDACQGGIRRTRIRIQSVDNSLGYQLHFQYGADEVEPPDSGDLWNTVSSVVGINLAVDYCDPVAPSCTGLTQSWPTVSYATTVNGNTTTLVVTDQIGRATTYAGGDTSYTIRRPGSATDNFVVTYASGILTQVTRDGLSWNYSQSTAGNIVTTTVTDPLGHQSVVTADATTRQLLTRKDPLLRTTTYTYDGFGRLQTATAPEGNYSTYTYDTRGNATQVVATAKAGSGLTAITTSAAYPSTCTNPLVCNQPTSTTDARSNTTDYTYDTTHGGVLTVTQPAPSVGAVRPQTRYVYTGLQAYFKNSSGTIVASGLPAYRLTSVSTCQSQASCAGTADEVKSTAVYGTAGVANNLNPTSTSAGSGNGTLTATTTAVYDMVGNVYTVDGPLPGTTDTTRLRYDAATQLVGAVGPDPDGAGTLKNRAVRYTYNGNGQVTATERGTVLSQSDGDWANFVSLQTATSGYDTSARKVQDAVVVAGTTYSLAQYSYDSDGRPECQAQRMNPAVYASLPSSACTLGTTGTFGPDRITRTLYDAADQVTKVQTAYGTALQRDEATATYTQNGRTQTVADAKNNLTTYVYDGFDRLSQTQYPSPTSVGSSNTADYEGQGYDPTSNVVTKRQRSGDVINLTYDALNRLSIKDIPGGTTADVYNSYDNLGRLLSARFGSTSGGGTINTFDALGRLTDAIPNFGTQPVFRELHYQYDLAGRRTRMSWWDSNHVVYDYDAAGGMTAIRLNGATSGTGVLATFAYDNLGRRTALGRGNGTSTSYGYDAVSRLTSLSQDLTGTVRDLTVTLGGYSPAGQIGSRTRSNDAYAWTRAYNVSRSYTSNGLNQLTASGGASLGYDTRGNLVSDGTATFSYDVENRMKTIVAGGYGTFDYDPVGRLSGTCCGAHGDATWAYDGDHLTMKTANSSGGPVERYVFGPNGDEPLVLFYSGDVSTPRWLHADERGSIIAISDSTGTALATNAYDDYGIPQNAMGGGSPIGPFGYTGQAWVPEAGVYNYKARFYSPTIGRFMQTDPIGYGDGMNVYNYVGNDPVNASDPSGLAIEMKSAYSFSIRYDGGSSKGAQSDEEPDLTVTGRLPPPLPCLACSELKPLGSDPLGFTTPTGSLGDSGGDTTIVVTANKKKKNSPKPQKVDTKPKPVDPKPPVYRRVLEGVFCGGGIVGSIVGIATIEVGGIGVGILVGIGAAGALDTCATFFNDTDPRRP